LASCPDLSRLALSGLDELDEHLASNEDPAAEANRGHAALGNPAAERGVAEVSQFDPGGL
jgi:hypothetical protein